jgi:hypothetical protein
MELDTQDKESKNFESIPNNRQKIDFLLQLEDETAPIRQNFLLSSPFALLQLPTQILWATYDQPT